MKPWGSPADEATELVLSAPAILDLTTFLDLRPFAGFCVRFGFLRPICGRLWSQICAKTTNGQTKGQFLPPIPVRVLAPLLNGTKFRICTKARWCLDPQAQLPRKCFTGKKRTLFFETCSFLGKLLDSDNDQF